MQRNETQIAATDAKKYCVVLGCKNTGSDLNVWRRTPCATHNHAFHSKCGCLAPFTLFPFPNSEKLKKLWLYRIGLPELEVSDSTCICSIHFVEGRPTSRSFFPTLYLQLEDEDELVDGEESGDEDTDAEPTQESDQDIPVIKNTYHYEEEAEEMQLFVDSVVEQGAENANDAKDAGDSLEQELDFDFEESGQLLDKSEEIGLDARLQSQDSESPKVAREDDDDEEIQVLFQSATPAPSLPLAQYDANSQTLQISNPVKYIMECHARIAALVAENQKLKVMYDNNVKRLTAQNNVLKRKLSIATQSLTNGATPPRAAPQSTVRPKCKLAPTTTTQKIPSRGHPQIGLRMSSNFRITNSTL